MTSINPFALLQDESEELPTKIVQKAVPVKKAPQPIKKQVVGKVIPIEKNTVSPSIKDDFEHESKHIAQVEKSHVRQKPARGKEFDKKSSSKVPNAKKADAGWGAEVEQDVAVENGQVVPLADVEMKDDLLKEEKEVEENFKSFAEYKAERDALKVVQPLAIRQANEGVDDSKWKKLNTPFVKNDVVEDLFAGLSKDQKNKDKKEKPAKNILVIEQTFAPPPRDNTKNNAFKGKPAGPRAPRPQRENTDKPARFEKSAAAGVVGDGIKKDFNGKKPYPKSAPKGTGYRGNFAGKAVNVMDTNAFPSLS